MRVAGFVVIGLLLCCCAPPPSAQPVQSFVTQRELKSVSLAREGLGYLAQNRFIDAELRLRQALYLAPQAKNLQLSLAAALEGSEHFDEAEMILNQMEALVEPPKDLAERRAHLSASRRDTAKADEMYAALVAEAETEREFANAAKHSKNRLVLAQRHVRNEDARCAAFSVFSYLTDTVSAAEYAQLLIAQEQPDAAVRFVQAWQVARPGAPGRDSRLQHLVAAAELGRGNSKIAYDAETVLLRSTALPPNLARECRIVRLAAAQDPQVFSLLTDGEKEDLSADWEQLGEGIDLSSKEAGSWSASMLELLSKAIVVYGAN